MDNNKTQSSSAIHFNFIALLLYINMWLFLFLLQNSTRHIWCHFSKTLQRTQLSLLCHKRATSEQYNSPVGKPSRVSGGPLTTTEQIPSKWSVSFLHDSASGITNAMFSNGFAQKCVMHFWNLQIITLVLKKKNTHFISKKSIYMGLSIIYKYNEHLLFFLAVGDFFFLRGKSRRRACALHTRPHSPLLNNMPAIKSSKHAQWSTNISAAKNNPSFSSELS